MPVNVGPDALIGEVVDGRYTVLERIAAGGMATVYRAVDTRLDRDVALKVMRPHLAHDESFVARFRREARAAARLSHPNIVSVFDQGEDRGRVFLAMEYVPGRTLRDVIEDDGPLSPDAALDILEPVLLALAEAHHQGGIIHRDVKPENVIIRDDGVVKVADFGLARAVTTETATSASSEVLGTLSYISPEQVEGGKGTPRSDVYAAGLLLFEMLTGRKAFEGDSIPHVIYQHIHHGVPTPSRVHPGIPPNVDSLVLQAAAKDPDDRPQDAAEFLAEVRHVRRLLGDGAREAASTSGPSRAQTSAPLATAVLPVHHDQPATAATLAANETQPYAVTRPPARAVRPAPRPVVAKPRKASAGARAIAAPPAAGKRRRRTGILAGLLALLAGAAAAGWYFLAGPGAPTTVPQLSNLTRAQAHSALETAHLDAKDVQAFSETVAKGVVISATPGEGASLRRGEDVTLTISKGKERYEVPVVAGITYKTALARLAARNLEGEVTRAYSDTVEKGRVVSSTPVAGTELKRGDKVTIVVSDGPQPIDVPTYRGMTLEEAQAAATAVGLTVAEGEQVYSTDVEQGRIVAQTPAEGQVVRGATITVQVSKGPEMVEVPSVFNLGEAKAVATLEAAGFAVKVEKFLGAPLDVCTGQTPGGGEQAPKGSTVTITIV